MGRRLPDEDGSPSASSVTSLRPLVGKGLVILMVTVEATPICGGGSTESSVSSPASGMSSVVSSVTSATTACSSVCPIVSSTPSR